MQQNIDPNAEWFRPYQAPRYGVSRATIYEWMEDGLLESKLVKRPGMKSGCRFVSVKSLKKLIEGSPEK
jgi:predicted site-specific integrase-resolvase